MISTDSAAYPAIQRLKQKSTDAAGVAGRCTVLHIHRILYSRYLFAEFISIKYHSLVTTQLTLQDTKRSIINYKKKKHFKSKFTFIV